MNILYFAFGSIVGLGLASIVFIAALFNAKSIDEVIKSIQTVSQGISREKGSIIFPKTDETIAMEEEFEANDRAQKDTLIGEIESDD